VYAVDEIWFTIRYSEHLSLGGHVQFGFELGDATPPDSTAILEVRLPLGSSATPPRLPD
jgi:hypothetical protein